MKKNKYKIKKWVLVPIFLLLCSLVIGLNYINPVNAYQEGVSDTDVPNEYYSLAPNDIYFYVDGTILDPTLPADYLAVCFPQLTFGDLAIPFDGYYQEFTEYNPFGEFYLRNDYQYLQTATTPSSNIFINAYRSIVVPSSMADLTYIPGYVCISYDYLIFPSYIHATSMMATSFYDSYSGTFEIHDGDFVYLTCDIAYFEFSSNGSSIVKYLPYELTFDSLMPFYSTSVSNGVNLVHISLPELIKYIENELYYDYNLGQFLLYFENLKIYGSTYDMFSTDETQMSIGYITTYFEKDLHSFFDDSDASGYHSYYLSIIDYFSNPNIPPLEITPIEPVDMSSWLLTAVGAFMSAELFPGFAIAGILAVIVAFPLAIWLLKVALGG